MFYELIYTRCRQGIDILKKGQSISSDGYKVYACTPEIMDEGALDLSYFSNTVQTKQSYSDPDFMDDAYIYCVPDKGKSFLMNFHPVPFDKDAKGDYSHRPGNFVNHALVGDFSEYYPFEMFKDGKIWNAQKNGEAYYYENIPSLLPVRSDEAVMDPPGEYSFDEIGSFIADGRKEALVKTVSFLISQYNMEPEKRKYLVIRDESSRNIELWVAAIECAFSPKMAASIPFATRMDKFLNVNRYTVKFGLYQIQMNLQDPNHKQRYRAMIVGVDERDKANINAVRPLANSPFVLLDGKQKQAMFESDISNKYYQLITKFDDEHLQFCREFLQTFGSPVPTIDIYDLFDIYMSSNKLSIPDARTLIGILNRIKKYKASNTSMLRNMYKRINGDIAKYLQEDFSSTLNIINWLQENAKIVGDVDAKQHLTENVCAMFKNILFGKTDNNIKRTYWTHIKSTEFIQNIARVITNNNTIKDNEQNLSIFSPVDYVTFFSIYLDSLSFIGSVEKEDLKSLIKLGISICFRKGDIKSLNEIISDLSKRKIINTRDFLLASVNGENKGLGEFIIKYLIDFDSSIIASNDSMLSFCKILNKNTLEHLIVSVLLKRANLLGRPSDMELFIKAIQDMAFIKEKALLEVFESIDSKISISANDLSSLAELLQMNKPKNAVCKNSAHIYALKIIKNYSSEQGFIDAFKSLNEQRFPTITNDSYINTLVDNIIKLELSEKGYSFVLDILSNAPMGYFSAYVKKVLSVAAKHKEKWNFLIIYAVKSINSGRLNVISDSIVQAIVDSKQNAESLSVLGLLIKDKEGLKYYNSLAEKALEIIASQKQHSGIGKLFNKFFGANGERSNLDKTDRGKK